MKNNNSNFRIFLYKTLFIFFCIYLLYNFTIWKKIDDYENKLLYLVTDQERELARDKFREELEKSLTKDNLLNKDDKILLKRFIKKLTEELINDE